MGYVAFTTPLKNDKAKHAKYLLVQCAIILHPSAAAAAIARKGKQTWTLTVCVQD